VKAGPFIGPQNSGDTAENSSDRTSDDRTHWTASTITFAGAAFDAFRHSLGGRRERNDYCRGDECRTENLTDHFWTSCLMIEELSKSFVVSV
jgi:hypothetical protein